MWFFFCRQQLQQLKRDILSTIVTMRLLIYRIVWSYEAPLCFMFPCFHVSSFWHACRGFLTLTYLWPKEVVLLAQRLQMCRCAGEKGKKSCYMPTLGHLSKFLAEALRAQTRNNWRHLLLTLFDPCLPVGAAIFMATESGQTVELHGVAFLSHTRQVPTSFTEMFHFNAAVMGFNSATLSFITLQNGKVDLHCIGFDAICEREKVSTPSFLPVPSSVHSLLGIIQLSL